MIKIYKLYKDVMQKYNYKYHNNTLIQIHNEYILLLGITNE